MGQGVVEMYLVVARIWQMAVRPGVPALHCPKALDRAQAAAGAMHDSCRPWAALLPLLRRRSLVWLPGAGSGFREADGALTFII